MKRIVIVIAFAAALSACGSRTQLKPGPNMTAVPKAAASAAPETPEQLMAPTSQARPERTVDLRTRSEERQIDPFDTPPGVKADTVPATGPAANPDNDPDQ